MESKLLPCPFCGGKAEMVFVGYTSKIAARCGECFAQTEWSYGREEAIKAWNTRAEPQIDDETQTAQHHLVSLEKITGEAWKPERTTTRNGKFKTKYGNRVPLCECCGYAIGDKRYNHCPNCGAKVVK